MSDEVKEYIKENNLIFVFEAKGNKYYLGNDQRNIIIYKERPVLSGKNKGERVIGEHGYYPGSKALLNGLHREYSIINVDILHKPEALVGIECFVERVKEAEKSFNSEKNSGGN